MSRWEQFKTDYPEIYGYLLGAHSTDQVTALGRLNKLIDLVETTPHVTDIATSTPSAVGGSDDTETSTLRNQLAAAQAELKAAQERIAALEAMIGNAQRELTTPPLHTRVERAYEALYTEETEN